jgi:hypothetical protein
VTWQLKGRNNGARRNLPLLGNGSVTTNTYATIEELYKGEWRNSITILDLDIKMEVSGQFHAPAALRIG